MYLSDSRSKIVGSATGIVLIVFIAMQLGCAGNPDPVTDNGPNSQEKKAMDAKMTMIMVRVISSEFDVTHDDFEDGSWDTQYLTKVEIVEPSKYRGGKLMITHLDPPVSGSIWVEKGKQLQIEVEGYVLDHQELMIPVGSIAVLKR